MIVHNKDKENRPPQTTSSITWNGKKRKVERTNNCVSQKKEDI